MTDLQKRFNAIIEKAPGTLILRGSNLLVETLDYEIKSAGGLIIANDSNYRHGTVEANKLQLGTVLMVGEGYYNEDGSTTPCDIPRGAIIILPKIDTQIISVMPGFPTTQNRLHLIPERSITMWFKSREDFIAYEKAIQSVTI